jgi:hypothetical protein
MIYAPNDTQIEDTQAKKISVELSNSSFDKLLNVRCDQYNS